MPPLQTHLTTPIISYGPALYNAACSAAITVKRAGRVVITLSHFQPQLQFRIFLEEASGVPDIYISKIIFIRNFY